MKERAVPTQIAGSAEQIRSRIEELIGPQPFRVWFKDSARITCGDKRVTIGVPNLFVRGWIEDHYAKAVAQATGDVLGKEVAVAYTIDPVLFRRLRKSQLNSQAVFVERSTGPGPHAGGGNGQGPRQWAPHRKLRGRLEAFVVGPSNRLAHSVACSVVESPLAENTPVFFHGGCGLGKTHLLHGIANALTEKRPSIRWLYVSGEEFTNQFICALRERSLDAFRRRIREIDVLLLDDMHFIANKKATQEEFLHTFNAIDAAGRRVVLASDAHPKTTSELSEPLVSRLIAGMVIRIETPDFETRCEILRRRAAQMRHTLPEPVVLYLAEKIRGNVRELEGCLLKLLAFAALADVPVTPEIARQAMNDHLGRSDKAPSVEKIEHCVAGYFGLTIVDLHGSSKNRTIVLARNIAMHLARTQTGLSFPEIARLMGNKDHTTVLHACRRIDKLLKEDAEVAWRGAAGPQVHKLRGVIEEREEQLRQ